MYKTAEDYRIIQEGMDAYNEGKAHYECPYTGLEDHTLDAYLWLKGWFDAERGDT